MSPEDSGPDLFAATTCPACGSSALKLTRISYQVLIPGSLAAGGPPDYLITAVKFKLRCRECGEKRKEIRGSIPHVGYVRKSKLVVVR